MTSTAVICIAANETKAQNITATLQQAGFSTDDISVLFPDRSGIVRSELLPQAQSEDTAIPAGALSGGGAGGVIGGAVGWMIGIGAMMIPGVGPFIVAGPLMSMLAGAAVGASIGSITGTLVAMGIPEASAKDYESKIQSGNVLISVHTHDPVELKTVQRIFHDGQAEDIAISSESTQRPTSGRQAVAGTAMSAGSAISAGTAMSAGTAANSAKTVTDAKAKAQSATTMFTIEKNLRRTDGDGQVG